MPNPKSSDTPGFSDALEMMRAEDAAFEAAFPFPFGEPEVQTRVRSDHQPRQSMSHVPEMLFNPSYVAAGSLSRIYSETSWQTSPDPIARRRVPPPKADPETVAAELRLDTCHTRRELRQARRRFALANHPDRVDPWLRDIATRRMTIANMLVDQALKQMAREAG